MNYTNLSKIALNAIRRNKMRSFLTMLGIIIGVGSVIAMLAIGQGSTKSIKEQVSNMGTNMLMVIPGAQQRGGVQMGNANSQSLVLPDLDAIRKNCPSVTLVSPEVRSSGQVIAGHVNALTTLYGASEDYLKIKKITVREGCMFTDRDIRSYAKVCLLGKTVIKNLYGSETYNPIGQTIRFKSIPMKVIGVLSEKGQSSFGQDQDDIIIAPFTTVQKRILAITHIQTIYTSAVSEAKSSQASDEIEAALRISHKLKDGEDSDFTIRSQAEMIKMFSSISNMLTILLGAIASISLLVGGIGIMNIMYVSVTERIREIGLRMAVGGRGIDILMQFLMEAIFLSVIGGVIGILLGVGASKLLSMITTWQIVVMPASIILSFLVCTIIGVFFGWYPARKAANLDPIDALRYE